MSKKDITRFGRRTALGLIGTGLSAPFILRDGWAQTMPELTKVPDSLKGDVLAHVREDGQDTSRRMVGSRRHDAQETSGP